MKLYKGNDSVFALGLGEFILGFDCSYTVNRTCVVFHLRGLLVARINGATVMKFAKAVQEYDNKNGTELIKEWGLQGVNCEQL